MAILYSSNLPTQKPLSSVFSLILATFMLLLARNANSSETTKFNFNGFNQHDEITLQGTSKILANGILELTNNSNPTPNTGRALYTPPVHIWNSATGNVASFVASFSFVMEKITICNVSADGIIFFLASPETKIPANSAGGNLGIVDGNNAFNRFIGIEFDNRQNIEWDPTYPHIGIDANSVISLKHVKWNWVSGTLYHVSIIYDSSSKTLSVSVSDQYSEISTVAQVVNLKAILPEKIRVGFSASTASGCQKHDIYSWSFASTLETSSSTSNSTNTINNNIIATYT